MHVIQRAVEINKSWERSGYSPEPIRLRRGEHGLTQIVITLTDNGVPFDLSGCTARLCAQFRGGQFVREEMTVSGSRAELLITSSLTAVEGKAAVAYVEVTQGDTRIASDDIPLYIMPEVDIDSGTEAAYKNEIDAILEEGRKAADELASKSTQFDANEKARQDAEEKRAEAEATRESNEAARQEKIGEVDKALEDAQQAVQDASEAKESANEAAQKANEATESANSAATSANEAAQSASEASKSANEAAEKANTATETATSTLESYADAEKERVANEEARVEAENARADAESLREEAETARGEAESGRASGEATRESQEAERVAAELLRTTAETGRVNAETKRDEAESARENAESTRETWYTTTKQAVDDGAFDGATFTPAVDGEGNLSWSNDKELPNPETQNIKGPKGDKGEGLELLDSYESLESLQAAHPDNNQIGDAYMGGTHYYTWNGSEWADCGELQGAKGDTGAPGKDGQPGKDGAPGKDGVSVTHEWEGTTLKITSASGTSSADLQGTQGERGPAGQDFKPGGTNSQIVLGDGTTIDISTFLTNNIETIRTALGLATTEHAGLAPQIPEV